MITSRTIARALAQTHTAPHTRHAGLNYHQPDHAIISPALDPLHGRLADSLPLARLLGAALKKSGHQVGGSGAVVWVDVEAAGAVLDHLKVELMRFYHTLYVPSERSFRRLQIDADADVTGWATP